MLKNIPTSSNTEEVSLRLYFTALDQIVRIMGEIRNIECNNTDLLDDTPQFFYESGEPIITNPDPWLIDKDEFLGLAQPDLQLAYMLIQQSQEIALKAMICAVSPFLLLLGSDVRTWPKSDADFSQFRTLDASDLVKVVNTVCPRSISDKFAGLYEETRRNRNQIYHQGTYEEELHPKTLLGILVRQYEELYQGRIWFRDVLVFERQTRHNVFFTDKFNARTAVLSKLATLFELLSNNQYLTLFGFSKKVRRYICHDCCYDASIEETEVAPQEVRTATLKGRDVVYCHLCEKEYPVRRYRCRSDPCKSNVISADEEWADHCHLCGEDQKEFENDDDDDGAGPTEITALQPPYAAQ